MQATAIKPTIRTEQFTEPQENSNSPSFFEVAMANNILKRKQDAQDALLNLHQKLLKLMLKHKVTIYVELRRLENDDLAIEFYVGSDAVSQGYGTMTIYEFDPPERKTAKLKDIKDFLEGRKDYITNWWEL